MKTILILLMICCISAYTHADTVILRQIQQDTVEPLWHIDPNLLFEFLQGECASIHLNVADVNAVREAWMESLIDNAVLEILVTGDVKHALMSLDDLEKPDKALAADCNGALSIGADILIDIDIRPVRRTLYVQHSFIDCRTGHLILRKYTYCPLNDPHGTVQGTARRIADDLWSLLVSRTASLSLPKP